ncbi:hypothetical protein Tco_0010599 [Tanacetum coccineum]
MKMDIRFHFIKEHVENGVIELYFVNTEYQLADIFIKALVRERNEFLINKLGMQSFTPETLKKLADEVDELMEISIADQIALDDALVAPADRLKIVFGHSGDIKWKIPDVNVNKLLNPGIFAAIITKSQCFIFQIRTTNTKKGNAMYYPRSQVISSPCHGKKPFNSSKKQDEGTGVTPGVPDAPDYDSEDDISWKSSDDDQDDEKAQDDQDDEKAHDDEDDDVHDDENVQDDDNEEQTESEDDVHTPSQISSSDDEDSNNEVEGMEVEGAKLDDDDTYGEDQGNEAAEDTNANLEGRNDVMTDVILPQVQATQEIEDTHVTLTLVNPDGQQQSSSVSSGFVSNMLNQNQDTGVDDIFEPHAEATSLTDTPVTAIVEPSFSAPTNHPPTPNPLVIQLQQPPIQTPATTTSSSLQNLPNFASLFSFDYRLKALEDNFSELKQTNQYAEALSSIPGIIDQYLANKMKEAVDVAVQLKYDRILEESNTANQ